MRTPRLWLSALLLLVAAACGTSSSTSVTEPSGTRCGVSVQAAQKTVAAEGGTGSIAVDTARECQWSATAEAAWLSITSGGKGQGSGTLTYAAAPNASLSARVGNIGVNDQRVEITQAAGVCDYAVTPDAVTTGAAGGELRVSIATAGFCPWTAVSRAPWIDVSSASGTGGAEIALRVGTNTGPARSGNVEIGGRTVTVSQDAAPQGCAFAIAPSSAIVEAAGQAVTVTVTTAANCAWSVASDSPWITINGPAGGTGGGAIALTVAANTGAARAGTVTIAGQRFSVTQAAASTPAPPCTFAVSPSAVPIDAAGGSATVSVTANDGCSWNISGLPSWISAAATGGAGNGAVTLNVSANAGPARTATLTIAGQQVTVTQAAAATTTCAYAIEPAAFAAAAAGETTTVAVTTSSACGWTTSGAPEWVVVTGGTGTGNGTVTIAVLPNTGAARSATVTIAGQPFTVTQAAGSCSFEVAPTTLQVNNNASTQTITVTTSSSCAWTATVVSGGSWLTIASGASGTGSGSVQVSVDRNREAARTGTLTVAGKLVTINQDGK